MMVQLDLQSRVPIYEQLYRNITRMVALGALLCDEQLPTVRALAQELGVNPNTVQKAYQLLEKDRIIYTVVGRGTFVSPNLSAVEQKKQLAGEGLKKALAGAQDAGLTRAEIDALIEQFYRNKEGEV